MPLFERAFSRASRNLFPQLMTHHEQPGESVVFTSKWFDVIAKPMGQGDPYYSIRILDYTCIVAFTPEHKLILIRQHRPVLGMTTLELPGGQVERNETPEQAARKELLEETGYVAQHFELLGAMSPDSGRLENRMWYFLALDCVPTPDPAYRVEEGIDMFLYDGTVTDLMADQTFMNSMHGTALFMALLKKQMPLKL